jgi:hypothetical protein
VSDRSGHQDAIDEPHEFGLAVAIEIDEAADCYGVSPARSGALR